MTDSKHQVRSANRITLQDLNLSVRAQNALRRQGIGTLKQILRMSSEELESIRGIGEKTKREIREVADANRDNYDGPSFKQLKDAALPELFNPISSKVDLSFRKWAVQWLNLTPAGEEALRRLGINDIEGFRRYPHNSLRHRLRVRRLDESVVGEILNKHRLVQSRASDLEEHLRQPEDLEALRTQPVEALDLPQEIKAALIRKGVDTLGECFFWDELDFPIAV